MSLLSLQKEREILGNVREAQVCIEGRVVSEEFALLVERET